MTAVSGVPVEATVEGVLTAHMWDASDDSLCSCGWSPDNYFAVDAEDDRRYVRDALVNAEQGDEPDVWAPVVQAFVAHQRGHILTAALPSLREQIAAEVLNDAADAIQALHPGEVKASVTFLRKRALSAPVQAAGPVHSPNCGVTRCAACEREADQEPTAGEDGAAWFDHDKPMPAQAFEPDRDACVHCGQPINAHGGLGPWCIKAGYYGNRYTPPAAEEVGGEPRCDPCAVGRHGNCQAHTVSCWCRGSDGASDGGRLG